MLSSHAMPPAARPEPPPAGGFPRVPTGIAGLDTILHGGFFRGGLYLITGAPGTGKTILGNQIAVHHAAAGGRVLFTSLLSETHSRMFAHLSSLAFFTDPAIPPLIGDALYYISGYSALQTAGLPGLLTLLQATIRDRHTTLLLLDGVGNAESFATTNAAFKEFLHSLQQYAELYGCTVLLLSSRGGRGADRDAVDVRTTVDGILRLRQRPVQTRIVREVQIVKLRGSGYLPGGHLVVIGARGVVVYPRLEALQAATVDTLTTGAASLERLDFGIAGLTAMLHGGLFRGSATALLGPPGSGKTLLGLHFLAEGARRGEGGLYFGLNEPPPVLLSAGDQVGLAITHWAAAGQIALAWYPATAADLDVLAQHLLEQVRARRVQRVFLDGLDAFSDLIVDAERIGPFFAALTNELRALGVTTLVAVELPHLFGPTVEIPIEGVSAVVENILFLRYVELRSQLYRLISVLKMRRSGHDLALRQFQIDATGITIADTFASAEAILTGLARPVPGAAGGAADPARR